MHINEAPGGSLSAATSSVHAALISCAFVGSSPAGGSSSLWACEALLPPSVHVKNCLPRL